MTAKLFSVVPKSPFIGVAIHSFLLAVAFGMWLVTSENAAGFGFMLIFIIFLFDFPVMLLFFRVIWPYFAGNNVWPDLKGDNLFGAILAFSSFLIIGGLYWFCIVMIGVTIKKDSKSDNQTIGQDKWRGFQQMNYYFRYHLCG